MKRFLVFFLIGVLEFTGFPALAFAESAKVQADQKASESLSTLTTETVSSSQLQFTPGTLKGGIKGLRPSLSNDRIGRSANKFTPAKVRKLKKENYRPNEEIAVVIENGAEKAFETKLIDPRGVDVAIETTEEVTGDTKVITLKQPNSFRPGNYTVQVSDGQGGVSEQNFSWGVLAINPDKSIYAPGETANLAIAVLNELGEMVCDAQVELQIKNPNNDTVSLSTDNGKIKVNKECESHDFTLKPDYETNYKTSGEGTYEMTLKSQTKNGSYTITDSFKVQKNVSFDVKRISATRIYPPHTYPVTMEITANQDFEGTVSETVPANFKVSRPGQEILSDKEEIDAAIGASDSAKPVVAAPVVKAPDNLKESLIGYNTINNLSEPVSGKAVLGASVPAIGMPFSGPYPVTQEFGQSLVKDIHDHDLYTQFGMHGHDGIDFAMPLGTPLLAVDSGKVVLSGDGDYGTTIVIQHSWGRSYYGHLSETGVTEGQEVTRGSEIGKSGNTGISTGPHLHFGIKPTTDDAENGYYGKVDPAYYLGMKQSAGQVLGTATQTIPAAMNNNETIQQSNNVNTDVQILTWKISVKKGDKIKLGYNYLAPRISPQFYTLGPATFHNSKGEKVFQEIRKWQIASDALEMKMKRGSFTKSTCTATCTQSITGLGFKPKAIILEWTSQTTETNNFSHAVVGMGLGTMSGGTAQERSVTFNSEDNIGTSDTHTYRSATKVIVMNDPAAGANITTVIAAADLVSFDRDGFTLSWTTNDTNANIIHYTALGGADVTNAKAGTFSLTTGTGSLAVTDPGFRPDFVTFLSGFTGAADTVSVAHAHLNVGYAKSSTQEASSSVFSQDAAATALTFREQRTDASIILLSNTGTQDALADFTSMDATGFTLNKSDDPTGATEIYYLALQGGQYAVGSFNKNTTTGSQSVTGLSFRPSGVSFATDGNSTTTSASTEGIFSLGGATPSETTPQSWCNDTTGIQCTSSWTERRKITFNNSASTEDLTNFPVMVKLSSASANIDFNKTQFNGQDIRFVDASDPNTVLSHEIESWNEPAGEAIIWVKVPQIDARTTGDSITMYYGNASAPDGQDATNVWDSDFEAVWHLKENPAVTNCPTNKEICDSTSNAWHGDMNGAMTSANQVAGQVDGSLTFDGSNDDINFGRITPLESVTKLTISAWMKRSAVNAVAHIGKVDASFTNNIGIELAGDGLIYFYIADSVTNDTWGSFASNDTNWHHVVLSWDGTQGTDATRLKGYVDGVERSLSYTGPIADVITTDTSSFKLAHQATNFYSNRNDETRISTVSRSGEWIEAEYVTQTNAMNTFGQAETAVAQSYSEGGIALWDDHTPTTMEVATGSTRSKALQILAEPAAGSVTTLAEADMQSFDPGGFTLNWTTADATAQEILYWAAGSVTAAQEDYRWYKNTNAITPTTALEDENSSTIIPKNKATARLRANIGVGGNGLNASNQAFKLQYAAAGVESGVTATSDWCNDTTGVSCTSDWTVRRKITFNNAAASGALTDFPVLVKLDNSRIDYNKTQNSGQDIRFVDPDDRTTVLSHEIESWNESGYSYVWVKVPSLAASATDSIWMYYGNSGASDGQAATSVWDGSSELVQHLEETSACSVTFTDSTTPANNGSCVGSGPAVNSSGIMAGARTFDGSDDYISIPDDSAFEPGSSGFTIEAWVNRSSSSRYHVIADHSDVSTPWPGWTFYLNTSVSDSGGCAIGDICLWDGSNDNGVPAGISASMWYHVAVVKSGTGATFYVNGVSVGSITGVNSSIPASSDVLSIGADTTGSMFVGPIDEVRYSSTNRSSDWIRANYLTQTDAMNAFGQEQPYTTGGSSSAGWTDVADIWCNDASGGVTCNTTWSNRKRITFDNQSSSTALTNFPILVKLDSTRIDYSKTQDDGDDIRFVDPQDPTTALDHEIETWNESGTSYVWVEVPQLDANSKSDSIWMYYGNASVSSGQNPTGVWDGNTAAVYHMKQDPSIVNCVTNKEVCDSTTNANNADSNGSMTSADQVTGKINGAIDFDGSNDTLSAPDANSLDITGTITLSAWVRPTTLSGSTYETILVKEDAGGDANYALQLNAANILAFSFFAGGTYQETLGTTALTAEQWYHVSATYSDALNQTMFYVNGVLDATRSEPDSMTANTDQLLIGSTRTSGSDPWPGLLDEIRISNNVRTDDWIEAEYLTSADQMNTFGSEESQTTAVWKFKDNSSVTNGTTITTSVLSTATSGDQMTYQESNPTALTPTNLAVGEKREWDFSLDGSLASTRRTYYFRLVNADGTPLTSYTRYAQITIGVPNEKIMRNGKWFNNGQKQPFIF